MKCAKCKGEKVSWTIIPEIHEGIAWSSHVLCERERDVSLYHYQCANIDVLSVILLFNDLVVDIKV